MKGKIKKSISIAFSVLSYVFFALCLFVLAITISAKKNPDGGANLFGKQFRVVVSDSMEKCDQTDVREYEIKDIPKKSLVIIDTRPQDPEKAKDWYKDLKVGDVLTFRYVYIKQETITHRIAKIEEKTGGYILYLEGDNKASNGHALTQVIDTTNANSPNYVIGKVTGTSYAAGVVVTALKTPAGLFCIIIVPCLIIMGLEIFRLTNLLTEKKRERAKQNEKELEELKEKLVKLEERLQNNDEKGEDAHAKQDETVDIGSSGHCD